VEKREEEKEEADCKLTAGLSTRTKKNSVRKTSESYINNEELTPI
jgi:hypothetical protein